MYIHIYRYVERERERKRERERERARQRQRERDGARARERERALPRDTLDASPFGNALLLLLHIPFKVHCQPEHFTGVVEKF
jgi:hypothetical protein